MSACIADQDLPPQESCWRARHAAVASDGRFVQGQRGWARGNKESAGRRIVVASQGMGTGVGERMHGRHRCRLYAAARGERHWDALAGYRKLLV